MIAVFRATALAYLGLALAIATNGCAAALTEPVEPVDQIYGIIVGMAEPKPHVLLTGMQVQMFAQANDSNHQLLPITHYRWRSTDPAVADVDQEGQVTTKTVGSAAIVAEAGVRGGGMTIGVGVIEAVYVLRPHTSQMLPGQVRALWVDDLAGRPDTANHIHGLWSSSDPAVATVDGNGVITARAAGHASVQVEYPLGYPRTEPAFLHADITVQPMSSPLRFTQLAEGSALTCGLATGGEAWCWGRSDGAQLGSNPLGTAVAVDECMSVAEIHYRTGTQYSRRFSQCAMEPTRVATTLRFASVSVSGATPCALAAQGEAYCWGDVGALSGGVTGSATPVPVSATLRFASFTFPCGVTLTNEGWCWGPTGTRGTATPTGVVSQVDGGAIWQVISGGTGSYRCGLTTAGGVRCWGSNATGQLGTGDSVSSAVPVTIRSTVQFSGPVLGGVYNGNSCSLSTTGTIWCWGAGQPVPAPTNATLAFRSLAGQGDELCGIGVDGTGYCGGLTKMTAISSTLRFRTLTAGAGFRDHCGIAEDGIAYCAGLNSQGEAGVGAQSPFPYSTYFSDMRRVVGQ